MDRLATGYRARYYGPDGRRHKAPTLFQTKAAARAWLSLRHSEIVRDAWMPPEAQRANARLTFGDYAQEWLVHRDLKDRTREHYRKLLDDHLLPAFGTMVLTAITADHVKAWHAGFREGDPDAAQPCLRASQNIDGQRGGRREGPCQSVRPARRRDGEACPPDSSRLAA